MVVSVTIFMTFLFASVLLAFLWMAFRKTIARTIFATAYVIFLGIVSYQTITGYDSLMETQTKTSDTLKYKTGYVEELPKVNDQLTIKVISKKNNDRISIGYVDGNDIKWFDIPADEYRTSVSYTETKKDSIIVRDNNIKSEDDKGYEYHYSVYLGNNFTDLERE